MCGPSSALKAINTKIQNFSDTVTDEAKTVFGAANTVFNNLIGGLQQIVNGGPSQMGYSQAELNAKNAAAVQGGAAMARNLKGAAASGAAAIGGGNTVMPAGSTNATVLNAEQSAAAETAQAENQIVTEGYDQGNKNYEAAVGQEENLPSVFKTADSFNTTAQGGLKQAQQSQQQMDTASNWWQPLVMKAVTGAADLATGGVTGAISSGFGNMSGDSSASENIGNFFSGLGGQTTG